MRISSVKLLLTVHKKVLFMDPECLPVASNFAKKNQGSLKIPLRTQKMLGEDPSACVSQRCQLLLKEVQSQAKQCKVQKQASEPYSYSSPGRLSVLRVPSGYVGSGDGGKWEEIQSRIQNFNADVQTLSIHAAATTRSLISLTTPLTVGIEHIEQNNGIGRKSEQGNRKDMQARLVRRGCNRGIR